MSGNRNAIFWITENRIASGFPDVAQALTEPDGLLAAGGDLDPTRLLDAYRKGIFPWYEQGQPILWWSPDPRTVIYPDQVKVSRSLRKVLNKQRYKNTVDTSFTDVVLGCAETHKGQAGTWLTDEMMEAYIRLHGEGHAHSIECWSGPELVGGLYGMAIGRVFYGESMFSRKSDASKTCLVTLGKYLVEWGYKLIDCQVQSRHLLNMGAVVIPRHRFTELLREWCQQTPAANAWQVV